MNTYLLPHYSNQLGLLCLLQPLQSHCTSFSPLHEGPAGVPCWTHDSKLNSGWLSVTSAPVRVFTSPVLGRFARVKPGV